MRPHWILLAAWLVGIAYSYPGYMNYDACDQLMQARTGEYGDWNPPMMARMWHLVEFIVRGPVGMLMLQTSLFVWGLYAAFRIRFQPRAAALLAGALFLFPPILTPMSAVWKDAQMAGPMLAGFMLALRPSWWARGAGLVMLFYAVGVRTNAPFAFPPLCMFIIARWNVRGTLKVALVGLALTIAIAGTAIATNSLLAQRQYLWYRTIVVHDIVGTICVEKPMMDDEVRAALPGIELRIDSDLQRSFCHDYDPRAWMAIIWAEHPAFRWAPRKPDRIARRDAWFRLVVDHPTAWLQHRWNVMRELLGLSKAPLWEPVNREFLGKSDAPLNHLHTHSRFQLWYGDLAVRWSNKLVYRPWLYAVLGLILLGYSIAKRDGWLIAILSSGLAYEAMFFVVAPSPDFRYSQWMITCTCIALVTVFFARLRDGCRKHASVATSTPSPHGPDDAGHHQVQ